MKEEIKTPEVLRENVRLSLSPRHHAMLYAYLVRACKQIPSEDIEPSIKEFTIGYGMRRGRRMAKRAIKDGNELTALNYEVYQEWQPQPGDMISGMDLDAPEVNVYALKCPWYDVWNTNGMLDYGKYYCSEIDEALVKGFNPDLNFETVSNRTNGGEKCDFYHRGLKATEQDKINYRTLCEKVGKAPLKNWDYHIGDLYRFVKDYVVSKYGHIGEAAIKKALEDYRNMYGQIALELLLAWEDYDFESIDDYSLQ